MASSGSDSLFRHLVECPVCFELEGVPKVLPCRHTVCQKCLGSLPRIRPNIVRCPECHRDTVFSLTGPSNLPTNTTIVQLRDIINTAQQKGEEKACKSCGEPGQTTTHICKECDEQFCKICARKHPSKRFLKDHKPVPLTKAVCSEHGRPYTFFCLDCDRLLCFICHNRKICDHHQLIKLHNLMAESKAALEEVHIAISENIEINKTETQAAKMELIKGLKSIKQEKDKIHEHSEKLKEQIDRNVKMILDEANKHENTLTKLKEQVECGDQLCTLYKLKEITEAAGDGGIEKTLLVIPTIRAAIPPYPTPVNPQAFARMIFTPQNRINVGTLQEQVVFHSTQITCEQVWEKASVGGDVWDVVLLTEGRLAYTDRGTKRVVLMDTRGHMLADSITQKKAVQLQDPRGIAYHPTQHILLVCDRGTGHVVFLHPSTLQEKKRFKLAGISDPLGVCVVSDGSIVIGGQSDHVGVFDIKGKQLHLWNTYNNGDSKFALPYYVAVSHNDNILVSCNNKMVKIDKTGKFMCEWSPQGTPWGLTVTGNIVLVAHRNPDCVMTYNLQGGDARQVLAWDRGQEDQFGRVRSLSMNHNHLIIVGYKGIRMYRYTNK